MANVIDLAGFEPCELGLPESFQSFRESQREFVEWVTGSTKRFMAAGLPTGSGKSLAAMALARATGLRTAILTVTRGLEAQYLKDFADTGHLFNIHGKNNYPCGEFNVSCRFGELEGCRLAGDLGCTYECERKAAKQSSIVLTNYAYWIRINEMTRGLELTEREARLNGGPNPFELLILDEAGQADRELARSLSVNIRETWLRAAGIGGGIKALTHDDSLGYWSHFAAVHLTRIGEEVKDAVTDFKGKKTKAARDRVYALTELSDALTKVSCMNAQDWVCEMQLGTHHGRQWQFECAWPGAHAEQKLFLGIPKVVLIGATLKPVQLGNLAISKANREFREWPRVFPAHHTPVYHVPTVRMNEQVTEAGLAKWVDRIDEIIESRQDRKGIVHTVSYRRQKYLAEHSRFARWMHLNSNDPDSETAAEVVKRFKESSAPAVLVSPSFSTGWDFPYRDCEWQIIAKLAFPSRSKVIQARKERNKTYIDQIVMEDLVQACGRATRAADDRAEVFVVDDNVTWFMWRNKALAPAWFEVRSVDRVPAPGKRCEALRIAAEKGRGN